MTARALLFSMVLASGLAHAEPPALHIQERWTSRDGLPQNVVHRVLAPRSGFLWLGTQEGLVRFDGVRFTVFDASTGLGANEITALLEDGDAVWAGTTRGMVRFEHGRFTPINLGADVSVTELLGDGAGGMWVATERAGLLHWRPGEARAATVEGTAGEVRSLARVGDTTWIGGATGLARLGPDGRAQALAWQAAVLKLAPAADGALWVGTSAGLFRLVPGATTPERVAAVPTQAVYGVLEDPSGALWLGVEGRALLRLFDGRATEVTGAQAPTDVHTLAIDPDGALWAGSMSAGLFRLRSGPVDVVGAQEGLSNDVVWALAESRDGTRWVATDTGVDRLVDGGVEHALVTELAGRSPGGLHEDRQGTLWVGTNDGLLRVGNGPVRAFGVADGLGGALTRTVFEDRAGQLWVGTSHGLYRREGERFVAVPAEPGLPGDKINLLAEGADGTLWVGTTTGLARVRREQPTQLEHVEGPPALRSDVTALWVDAQGSLWVGTVGDGLVRRDASGRFDGWSRQQGLFEDTVLSIVGDDAELWLSGTHGLTRVARVELDEVAARRRARLVVRVLGAADGLRAEEGNGGTGPAGLRTRDGRLWFATVGGVAVLDPHRVPAPGPAPRVLVEQVVVDGRAQPVTASLTVPAGTRHLDFHFTAGSLTVGPHARFRVRLVGLDDAFLEAGDARSASYSRLTPGRYTFEVEAADDQGEWGPPSTVSVEVEAFFWQTRWFAGTLLVIGLALAWTVVRLRTLSLRRRAAELTARVEEEMAKVKVLRGLLPTCAWCKRIRNETGDWQRFETYLTTHADVHFTHGMCDECFKKQEAADPDP
ncbi:MAG: two-component regulator propeller domain-containing protein [Myxococcaceae bacterium]